VADTPHVPPDAPDEVRVADERIQQAVRAMERRQRVSRAWFFFTTVIPAILLGLFLVWATQRVEEPTHQLDIVRERFAGLHLEGEPLPEAATQFAMLLGRLDRELASIGVAGDTPKARLANAEAFFADIRRIVTGSRSPTAAIDLRQQLSAIDAILSRSGAKNGSLQERVAAVAGKCHSGSPGNQLSCYQAETCPQDIGTRSKLTILFGTGQFQLGPEDVACVEKMAKGAASRGTKRIVVYGHTDTVGGSEFNQRLSEDRAELVARIFARAGIPWSRLEVAGFGETKPLVKTGQDETAEPENRRVKITID
jgi:outer membrane protein OmpA-like peptidoglycan-associated protein